MTASAPRIAFLHTGAVVIAPVRGAGRASSCPDATTVNYLDDRSSPTSATPSARAPCPSASTDLVRAAAERRSGCRHVHVLVDLASSPLRPRRRSACRCCASTRRWRMPRCAPATASRVLATLPTTCAPDHWRSSGSGPRSRGASRSSSSEVIEGAFAAVASGDRATHDRLVAAAIERGAAEVDVIVLAQASMASAARRCRSTCRCSRAPARRRAPAELASR